MFKFAFFGTDQFARGVLTRLAELGLKPDLVVSTTEIPPDLTKTKWDIFLVASFGKILTAEFLAVPRHGCLNLHPSLLPKYRGATPLQSTLLAGDKETGVTLMLMDEQVDHGPIIAQSIEPVGERNFVELRDRLAEVGAELFAKHVADWLSGKINARPQNQAEATFTKKIKKEDGEINLKDSADLNLRKVRALNPWPSAYFYTDRNGKKIRVIVREAHIENGQFIIDRVLPEGKKEMNWADFKRGFK